MHALQREAECFSGQSQLPTSDSSEHLGFICSRTRKNTHGIVSDFRANSGSLANAVNAIYLFLLLRRTLDELH